MCSSDLGPPGWLCGERDQELPALREPGAMPTLLYPPGEEVWVQKLVTSPDVTEHTMANCVPAALEQVCVLPFWKPGVKVVVTREDGESAVSVLTLCVTWCKS